MATKRKTTKAAAKPAPKAEATEFKYGMENLIKDTGLQPASIRAGLRDSDFEREGRSWGWNTQADYKAVLAYFKDRSARKPDMAPAKKAPAKAKRGSKKKAA